MRIYAEKGKHPLCLLLSAGMITLILYHTKDILSISTALADKTLKVALQILGRKFYKKKNQLENHLNTRKAIYFSFINPQWSKTIRQKKKLEIYYGLGRHQQETRSSFT